MDIQEVSMARNVKDWVEARQIRNLGELRPRLFRWPSALLLVMWHVLLLNGCDGGGSPAAGSDAGDAADLSGSQGFATLTGG